MADPARARKIAERTKQLVTQALSQVVKDERVGFVTITDARVTGDLQHASVFYTVFGDDADRTTAAEVLEEYRGRIRSFVGKGLGIRLTPSLEFILDALPEDAQHLDALLAQVAARDAELAATRGQAGYAGEADPYKKPRADEDLEDDDLDEIEEIDGDEDVPRGDAAR